nr:ribonuclease H-like domain-containing protein [Tanacetum cinerariifolium]
MKNKVKAQPRDVNEKNRVVELICNVDIKQPQFNGNSEPIFATCKKSMFDGVHNLCILDFVKNVNSRAKSAKKHKKQNIWKPTGHVFTDVGFKWKPTCGTLTIVVVQTVLWHLDSRCLKHMTGNRSQLMNFVSKFLGVDLIFGSRDTNLYTISVDDMLKTYPICLLSKVSMNKSWLLHHRLSHLNFGTLNKLAKDGHARCIPRLKFQNEHLCSACALGKSKKSSHQPKAEDTNQEKLYLLHMDLCGPMRVMKKANIGIFVGYAPAKNAFRIYNKRIRKIIETIHVTFDELPAMASKQFRYDWDHLFRPMFDEYFNPPTIVVSPVQEAAAPRATNLADYFVSTAIDQDALSTSIPSSQEQEHSLIISQDEFGEALKNKDRLVAKEFKKEEGIDSRNQLHR